MNWLTNPPLSENEQTDDLNLRTVLNLTNLSKGSSINGYRTAHVFFPLYSTRKQWNVEPDHSQNYHNTLNNWFHDTTLHALPTNFFHSSEDHRELN
jgi:hypothetical protein